MQIATMILSRFVSKVGKKITIKQRHASSNVYVSAYRKSKIPESFRLLYLLLYYNNMQNRGAFRQKCRVT